ncbi:MAG TPA: helix-turn-helix domain-containing protein [Streptosporangiaceae bacterium]|nr:helix-turn-helix domain-containing protein [Streptosporangiaceae bacterium]
MRVRDLLDVPGLGLRLLTDVTGMDRPITHVYTTDLPDPGRYLTQGDLVLTGMIWCRGPGDADRFARAVARAGAGAVGAGEALGLVPIEVIEACARHGVALLAVPAETSFAAVIDEVGRRLGGDRASAMTRVLGRRRLLLSAVAEGAGLDEMFRLMGKELGLESWLLTGTGRVVGGTGPAMPRSQALRFAAEYLKADRLPAVARLAGDGEARYSMFGIGSEPRLTSWFLACAGREQDWAHELRESVAELVADVALERARLDAGRAGDRKLAEAIVTRLSADGASAADITSLLNAAELPPDGPYLVASIRADADGRMGGSERWRCDLAEELTVPYAGRALVAPLAAPGSPGEIVALVPLPAEDGPDGSPAAGSWMAAAHAFADRLRETRPVFEADRSRIRLSVGVSTPASGVAALAGALHEAGSARRLAAVRAAGEPGGCAAICVVTSDEVASHELLLASVPGTVLRSFRGRLLDPLLDYDEQHRAELLPTLREFLDCSGSWNACAAKMYVHVNTVRYRIRRIEELTGRDLSSLDDRVDFFLALRIRLAAASAPRTSPLPARLRFLHLASFLTERKRSTEENVSDLTPFFPSGFEFPLKYEPGCCGWCLSGRKRVKVRVG